MAVSLHLRHYRFGADDGTEASHSWLGAEDTAVTLVPDTPFLLRFAVWEEGVPAGAANNTVNQFQCRLNAGGWQNITTTSTICKAVAVGAFANGDNCTRRLTAKPTGIFEATGAGCTEDGNSGGNQNDITAGGYSETEAGLQLVGADLATGDVVQFRLVTTPTAIAVYDVTAQATVNMPSLSPSLSPSVSPSVSASVSISPSVSASVSPSASISPSLSPSTSVPPPEYSFFGRPDADVAQGTWTASSGSDLFSMLSETSANDLTYITSGASPTDDTCKLGISGMVTPAGAVTIRVRGKWTEAT